MAVTKTNNLKRGMKDANGSTDIQDVQKALNNTGYGYNLAVDGSYGPATEAAVRDFQKRTTGLKVDGIVGTNTWGALTSGASANKQTATQPAAPAATAVPEKSYRYDQNNDPLWVAANQKVTDLEANAAVDEKVYAKDLQAVYEQMMNQKPFEYDLNGDALWQQYKDQYTTQGKMAMMDTMGQAAALTGGYGSSYSQAAGQQAYQGYLQQLNDRVPELYQLAMDKYNNEQALLKNKFGAAAQMRENEYNEFLNNQNQWNTEMGWARDDRDTAYNQGSNALLTEQKLLRDDDNTAYSRQQDKRNSVLNMIATTGQIPTQAELDAAGVSLQEANAYASQYTKDQKAARSSGNKVDTSTKIEIPSEIKSQIEKYKTSSEKGHYISELELNGTINSATAEYMRKVYDAKFEGNDNTTAFMSTVTPESQHDAVMRATYGSYKQYLSQMIEQSDLTDTEKLWLISKNEITEADAQKKKH